MSDNDCHCDSPNGMCGEKCRTCEVEEAQLEDFVKQYECSFDYLPRYVDKAKAEHRINLRAALRDYASHIRQQERERVQKILDGYAAGIMKPFVQQIAAAIRES